MILPTRVRRGSETEYEIVADDGSEIISAFSLYRCAANCGPDVVYGVHPTEGEIARAAHLKPGPSHIPALAQTFLGELRQIMNKRSEVNRG